MTPIKIEKAEQARGIIVKDGVVEVELHGGATAQVTSNPVGGTVREIRQHGTYANYFLDGTPFAQERKKVEIGGVTFGAEVEPEKETGEEKK